MTVALCDQTLLLAVLQATAAIEAVNGQQLGATTLEVKYADADAGRGQVSDCLTAAV